MYRILFVDRHMQLDTLWVASRLRKTIFFVLDMDTKCLVVAMAFLMELVSHLRHKMVDL